MATIFDINAGCTIDETGLIIMTRDCNMGARSSTGYTTGKKYFEVQGNITSLNYCVGLCDINMDLDTGSWPSSASLAFQVFHGYNEWRITYGSKYRDVSFDAGVYTNPSLTGMAIDFDAHTIKVYYNGSLLLDENYSDKLTQIDTVRYPFTFTGGGGGTTSKTIWNFGLKPFQYPIPAGYKAWDRPPTQQLYLKNNAAYGMKEVL